MGYIYKITNLKNNDIYIGQTINSIEHRWKEHINTCFNSNRIGYNYILYKAIRKYGVENFVIEKVEQCDNELLNEREKYWIDKFDSYYLHNHGYNMTLGGEGTKKYSDEDILNLWNQGLKSCQIAEALNANVDTISERLKVLKPGEARQRHLDSNKKKVLQYDLNGNFIKEWDCVNYAEKDLHVPSGNITRCCKKERTQAFNSLWKYSDDSTSIEELMIRYAMSPKCNGVDLIDENDNILKHFESAALAEKENNIARGKISEVCNHKKGRKTAGGLRWQWSYPLKRKLIEI